jgi:hypothetical protein
MARPFDVHKNAEMMFGCGSAAAVSAMETLKAISPGYYATARGEREFLYLLSPREMLPCGSVVKIGRAASPPQRFWSLQNGSPVGLVYRAIFKAVNVPELERLLHDRYNEYRKHGEWFSIDPQRVTDFIDAMNWPELVRLFPAANDNQHL